MESSKKDSPISNGEYSKCEQSDIDFALEEKEVLLLESIIQELGIPKTVIERNLDSCNPISVEKLCFNNVNVVWGEEFTSFFLETSLPCLLSNENLPYMAERSNTNFDIYTTHRDAETIRKSDIYRELNSICKVRLFPFDNQALSSRKNDYSLMALCHSLAIILGKLENATLLILSPDCIVSDGTLKLVFNKISKGFKAVLSGTVRLNKQTGTKDFHQTFGTGLRIAVPPIEFVKFGLKHLHAQVPTFLWDGERSCKATCGIGWFIPQEGLILRSFQWHPLAVNANIIESKIETVIDRDLFSSPALSLNDIYLLSDTTLSSAFEFSHPKFGTGGRGTPGDLTEEGIANWAKSNTTSIQRELFKKDLLIHCRKDSAMWESKLEEAEMVANRILTLMSVDNQAS